MPLYTFRHKKTGKTFEQFMSISEGDAFCKANPGYERACGAPMIGDSWNLGITKADSTVTERINEIKKAHPGSTIKN